jgi:hypothetical protein
MKPNEGDRAGHEDGHDRVTAHQQCRDHVEQEQHVEEPELAGRRPQYLDEIQMLSRLVDVGRRQIQDRDLDDRPEEIGPDDRTDLPPRKPPAVPRDLTRHKQAAQQKEERHVEAIDGVEAERGQAGSGQQARRHQPVNGMAMHDQDDADALGDIDPP